MKKTPFLQQKNKISGFVFLKIIYSLTNVDDWEWGTYMELEMKLPEILQEKENTNDNFSHKLFSNSFQLQLITSPLNINMSLHFKERVCDTCINISGNKL